MTAPSRLTADGTRNRWREAARHLVPVPARYRQADLDAAAVVRLLGCDESVLADLSPLAVPGPDGAARFDYYDVMNLGLLAGTGRSLAELGERQCVRFAAQAPPEWLAPLCWRLRLEASCDCGEPISLLRPAVPAPGAIEHWAQTRGEGRAVAELTVRTAGRAGRVASPCLRELYDEVLGAFRSGACQFAWLPPALRADVDTALANRTLDCVVTSQLLCRRAAQAGLEARTRNGFLLGMVGVEHSWMEIHEDGRWLPADPVLAFLAGRSARAPRDFDAFCLGSLSNRALGWHQPAGALLAEHDCRAGGQASVSCRQLP